MLVARFRSSNLILWENLAKNAQLLVLFGMVTAVLYEVIERTMDGPIKENHYNYLCKAVKDQYLH